MTKIPFWKPKIDSNHVIPYFSSSVIKRLKLNYKVKLSEYKGMWHWTCLFLNSKNVNNNKIINAYFKHCVLYWLQFASCESDAEEKKTFTFWIWGERWTATLYVETVLVKLLFLNFMNNPIYGAKRFCCRSVMRMGQTGYYFLFTFLTELLFHCFVREMKIHRWLKIQNLHTEENTFQI